jgi:DNA polymerase-3 subunit beta
MKFTITREQLSEGVSAVSAAVPSKTTLPVLANILLEATKDGLRLSGTDLDIAVSTTVPASVDQEGAITLPARKLQELVRELPSAGIRFTTQGEQRVTIECGRSKFKLTSRSSWRTSPSPPPPKRAARSSTASCGSSRPTGCAWWRPTATVSRRWKCRCRVGPRSPPN